MQFLRRLAVFFLAFGIALLAGVSAAGTLNAQTVSPCQGQFSVLRADTAAAPITGGKVDKERAGLLKLIDDAQALAALGKRADAVTKLRDFLVKVDQLEAAGRLSAESATLLRSDAAATIACLQGAPA